MQDEKGARTEAAFLTMPFPTSATGPALPILRETPAMGLVPALRLGVVFALFVTMPHGKFVHGIYRFAALARYAKERHEPSLRAEEAEARLGRSHRKRNDLCPTQPSRRIAACASFTCRPRGALKDRMEKDRPFGRP